jgi:hypothetical protein
MPQDSINVYARTYESLATHDEVLRFPAPLAERAGSPAGFEFFWKMLDFAFELPDPTTFPRLGAMPSGRDAVTLGRYVTATEEMAGSALLSGDDAFHVKVKDGGRGIEAIETTFSNNEITRGFTTLFRQFDSSREAGSFDAVQGILRRANDACPDERSPQRLAQLTTWGKARASLRGANLKVRVGQRLRAHGRYLASIPGETACPRCRSSAHTNTVTLSTGTTTPSW